MVVPNPTRHAELQPLQLLKSLDWLKVLFADSGDCELTEFRKGTYVPHFDAMAAGQRFQCGQVSEDPDVFRKIVAASEI